MDNNENKKQIAVPLLLLMRQKEGSEDYEGVLAIDFPPPMALGCLSEPVTIKKGEAGKAPSLILKAAVQGLEQAWEMYQACADNLKDDNVPNQFVQTWGKA